MILFSYRTLQCKNVQVKTFIPAMMVLTVSLALFGMTATAQVKPSGMFLPSEGRKSINGRKSAAERPKLLLETAPILKLLKQDSEGPLSFAWQINTDTLLKKKDVFREMIEFEGRASLRKSMAIDSITLQKSAAADYDVRKNFLSFTMSLDSYEISQQKGKQVLVLESASSTLKLYFKVFLDKSGKRILKLQNLSNRRIYLPVPFEGGTISM